jgi:hypothetical protein
MKLDSCYTKKKLFDYRTDGSWDEILGRIAKINITAYLALPSPPKLHLSKLTADL